MTVFGKRLKKIRREKKLTMEELAKISGLSTSLVCRLEKGNRFPSEKTLNKISLALNITTEELRWGIS